VEPLQDLNLTPQTVLINLSDADVAGFAAGCKEAIKVYNNHIDNCNKENKGN